MVTGSKDELVRAYLEIRYASVTQRIMGAVERYDTPRERLLAVFEGQGELFAQPGYRGCAFARASAESHPGDLTEQASEALATPACSMTRSMPTVCTPSL